jgi:hypothetical protein
MSNLAINLNGSWPGAVTSADLPIENASSPKTASGQESAGSFAFADIYLRHAPCYLKGLMLQARGEVKGKLRGPDAGVLAFEDGACEVSATSLFLTVSASATDDISLAHMQAYIEDKLRTMSPQTDIEFDWRYK